MCERGVRGLCEREVVRECGLGRWRVRGRRLMFLVGSERYCDNIRYPISSGLRTGKSLFLTSMRPATYSCASYSAPISQHIISPQHLVASAVLTEPADNQQPATSSINLGPK